MNPIEDLMDVIASRASNLAIEQIKSEFLNVIETINREPGEEFTIPKAEKVFDMKRGDIEEILTVYKVPVRYISLGNRFGRKSEASMKKFLYGHFRKAQEKWYQKKEREEVKK